MVRVIGSSSERVPIQDLNDVIYYRQQKVYSDQEFESSKDLDRAIKAGRVTKLEQSPLRSAGDVNPEPIIIRQQATVGISSEDIKKAISEVLGNMTVMKEQTVAQTPAVDVDGLKSFIQETVKNKSNGSPAITPEDIRKIVSDVVSESNGKATSQVNVNQQDIRKILTEILSEYQSIGAGASLQLMMQGMIPMIAEAVRQEVAKIPKTSISGPPKVSMFSGPEYVPNVDVKDMRANIQAEERTSAGGDVSGSLEALKRLKK